MRKVVCIDQPAVRVPGRLEVIFDNQSSGFSMYEVKYCNKQDCDITSFNCYELGTDAWAVPSNSPRALFLDAARTDTEYFHFKQSTTRTDKYSNELHFLHCRDYRGSISPHISNIYHYKFFIAVDVVSLPICTLLMRTFMKNHLVLQFDMPLYYIWTWNSSFA